MWSSAALSPYITLSAVVVVLKDHSLHLLAPSTNQEDHRDVHYIACFEINSTYDIIIMILILILLYCRCCWSPVGCGSVVRHSRARGDNTEAQMHCNKHE